MFARPSTFPLILGFFFLPFLNLRVFSYPVSDWFFLLSFLLILLKTPKSKIKIHHLIPGQVFIGFALLILGSLLSSIFSSNPLDSFAASVKFVFFGLGLLNLFIFHSVSGLKPTTIIYSFLFGSSIFAFSIYSDTSYIRNTSSNSFIRAIGSSDHVTNAAGVLVLAIAFCFVLIRNGGFTFVKYCIALWLGIALVFTGSVSGILALIICIMIPTSATGFRSAKNRLLVPLTGIVFLILVQNLKIYDLLGRLNSVTSGRYNTFASREANIFAGIEGLFSSLTTVIFGSGMGGQSGYVLDRLGGTYQVHNSLLQAWFQGGILTFIGFLIIWIKPFFGQRKNFNFGEWRYFYLPALAVFLFSMTSPLMMQRYIWIPILLLIASTILSKPDKAQVVFTTA